MKLFKEIEVPEGVNAELLGNRTIKISSDKGEIIRKFKAQGIKLEMEGNKVIVKSLEDNKKTNAIVTTVISVISNNFKGVKEGYEANLEVIFSHFPMNIAQKGAFVEINNFLGGKNKRFSKVVGEKTKVEVKGKEISVKGINKEEVGQTAANLEKATRVVGKDRRTFQDGIYTVSKPK